MAAFTTIDDPAAYFNSVLYTGDGVAIGSGGNTITGVGFQPDFTWIKRRTGSTDNHSLFNTPMGATKILHCNTTDAESTNAETLTSWNADGFVLGSTGEVNGSGQEQVAWNWLGGTTTGIDTTGTTITPSGYSFNQDAGFSCVKFTGNGVVGATLAHGLGAVPGLAFFKNLDDGAEAWCLFHHKMDATAPEDFFMFIDENSSRLDDVNRWNDTMPTSVNMILNTNANVNKSGDDYSAWFFAEKQGYSKFGSYVGNANADGTFVYVGFRPAFIISKRTSGSTGDWYLWDNKRLGYNPDNNYLYANTNAAEATTDVIDILSNGFKCRDSGNFNAAYTMTYWAFAESPFVNSNGVPTNAG